ncbi:7886_t:CDS:1, partial [Acaulospora colombiana]
SNATSTALPSPAQNGPGTPVSQLSAQPTRRGPKRAPLVYPALLSRVAEALLQRLPLSVRTKHGLSYPDAFDGREAVDKICYIIKTTDRSLALLLGRALDAQKFFHDVTYDHRLRDNSNEIYQFKSSVRGLKLSDSSTSGTILGHARGDSKSVSPNTSISGSSHRPSTSKASTQNSSASSNDHGAPHHYQSATEATVIPISNQSFVSQSYTSQQVDDHAVILMEEPIDEMELPTGVFTMLTECYSATCTRDHLCYSITCPRRMEQQARLNNRPGSAGGHRSTSGASSSRVGRRATIGGANGIPGSDSLPTSPVTSTSAHGHPQGGVARLEKRPE